MIEDEMVEWYHRLNEHEMSKLLEIVKDRGSRCVAVYEVVKSQIRLND